MPSSAGQTCARSEEHTSELQSHDNLVCRLLLEKKELLDRKSTRLNSSHTIISYAVFCLDKKNPADSTPTAPDSPPPVAPLRAPRARRERGVPRGGGACRRASSRAGGVLSFFFLIRAPPPLPPPPLRPPPPTA